MKILAIETSCDDTSVAIVEDGTKVISSVISSQAQIHSKYGGVVPEVAARHHLKNMIPILDQAQKEANCDLHEVDYIAVTRGPGLVGSLIVGVNTARMLAKIYKKPLIALHHTEGHIYANWLDDNLDTRQTPPVFPLLCLTVSGGHTNLIYMSSHLDYRIIGQTIDDSAGEAYDKVAKMLELSYPGGPEIAKLANSGNKDKVSFPLVDLTKKPARDESGFLIEPVPSLDFSFSGLKTSVLQTVRIAEKNGFRSVSKSDIAASFQNTINTILTRNLKRAIDRYKPTSILLSGGVAANDDLRLKIQQELSTVSEFKNLFYFPKPKYCTDNAAMIAAAAYYHIKRYDFSDPDCLTADPNLHLV